MPEFDPRRVSVPRYAPKILVGLAGLAAVGLGWKLDAVGAAPAAPVPAVSTTPSAQPGVRAEKVRISIRPGETFVEAVLRLGVTTQEAQAVVDTLGRSFDTVNIKAGLAFEAAIAKPHDRRGPVRLIGLSMRTGPASQLTLSRTFDGALRLKELQEEIHDETTVAQGSMQDSLYESALRAGATPQLTAEVVKLFSHKLDFSRDIHADDTFRMVFDRKVTDSGKTVDTGDLLYAELDAKDQVTRFYRFKTPGASEAQFFDEAGKNIRGFLLRTPVQSVRITSGFGMRHHPILGYNRMHQGIDFGASAGTPVFAAGDGVVARAGWAGGYGRQLMIKHNGHWATSYSHLSGFAVKPGQRVHQGQVVAYVGSTGRSTGPHLHYEIMHDGAKINPIGAKVPQGTILAGRELAAFKAQKARIDGILMAKADAAEAAKLAQAGLRTAAR
jgi:murein DD-endopeptidase MepM/ murein hydrolase activator NlpD